MARSIVNTLFECKVVADGSFARTVQRQTMLRRKTSSASDHDDTPALALLSHSAHGNLAEVDAALEVDVEDILLWKLEIAVVVEGIVEVVRILADAAVDDGDVYSADLFLCVDEISP